MSLHLLSQDPLSVIFDFCRTQDIIHLSETSRYFHAVVYQSPYITHLFTAVFGSFTKADAPYPLHQLAARTSLILSANSYFAANTASEKIQLLLNRISSAFGLNISLRSENAAARISNIYLSVATELVKEKPANLQDLRDKCLRLKVLENELHVIELALKKKMPVLNFLSKRDYIGSWRIKLGQSQAVMKGKTRKLDILAYPKSLDGNPKESLCCALVEQSSQQCLSEIHIQRVWRGKNGRDETESTSRPQELIKGKKYKLLVTPHFCELELMHDASTGDFPLQRLLLQLAVEIFRQDPAEVLVIKRSNGWNSTVDLAAGFFFASDHDNEIKKQLQTARTAGKLFSLRSNSNYYAKNSLLLKDRGHEFGTQFVKPHADINTEIASSKLFVPALVDFCLQSLPVSWEDIIAQKPLLTIQPNPQLPLYWSSLYLQLSSSEKVKGLLGY